MNFSQLPIGTLPNCPRTRPIWWYDAFPKRCSLVCWKPTAVFLSGCAIGCGETRGRLYRQAGRRQASWPEKAEGTMGAVKVTDCEALARLLRPEPGFGKR